MNNTDYLWKSYIKNPIKQTNGFFATYKGLYKIVNIKLCRHFSYVEIAKVSVKGDIGKPIYLSIVGKDWEDTNKRLAAKIDNYVNQTDRVWVDLGEISC